MLSGHRQRDFSSAHLLTPFKQTFPFWAIVNLAFGKKQTVHIDLSPSLFSRDLQVQLMVVATLALAVAVVPAVVVVPAVAVVPALLVWEVLDELAQEAFRVFLFHFP